MPHTSSLTFTDQFCGAGGSSQGVRSAASTIPGLEVRLALNHWQLAIDTHQHNFPDTMHDCTDIQSCDPRYYPKTDILITSPECTNHSLAKGQKQVKQSLDLFTKGSLDASAERSRATMWDVCRFAEVHKYKAIIVENVVDARKWIMFDAWLMAMHAMDYKHKCVYINSQHCHPTPQSRDRMYVVFWKKTQRAPDLNFTPTAHCPSCGCDILAAQTWKNKLKTSGKYRTQYYYTCPEHGTVVEPYYYAAFNAIDWSDIGKRIGDRKTALSENTIKRIQHGLNKYGIEPFQVIHYTPGYTKRLTEPTGTITANDHHSLLTPFIIKGEHMQAGETSYVKSAMDSFQTQTVRQSMSIVQPPFIIEMNRTGKSRKVDSALSTILANGNHHGLLTPLIVNNKGLSKSHQVTNPLGSQTTKPHFGIVTDEAFNSFIHYNRKQSVTSIKDPIQTIATKDQSSLISYQKPKIDDCFYRMLKPHEIQAGMAFADDYTIKGNSRDKVKQLGNAVTPPVMEWLVKRVVQSLN